VGVALGLAAALCWGLADYFAAVAGRSIGAPRVVLGFHVVATVLLLIAVLASGALASLTWHDVPLFVFLGVVGWLSYLTFYGALEIGPISVLSPIISGYAVVTVLLAVVIGAERPAPGVVVAIIVVAVGVTLAGADVRQFRAAAHGHLRLRGVALAVLAMVLLGGFVYGVSSEHQRLGWLAPIFLARGFAAVLLIAWAARGRDLRGWGASRKVLMIIALLAVLDTGGYVFFNLGVGAAPTAVVATASAPYAVVPIIMGIALLSERPTPSQWRGVALVIGGLVLLGLAQ
jgi:drug/metabolite transporter (DMT)-like permease